MKKIFQQAAAATAAGIGMLCTSSAVRALGPTDFVENPGPPRIVPAFSAEAKDANTARLARNAIVDGDFRAAAGLCDEIGDAAIAAEIRAWVAEEAARKLPAAQAAEWATTRAWKRGTYAVDAMIYRAKQSAPAENQPSAKSVLQALSACQIAIDSIARFRVLKAPGYVENSGRGDAFRFVWPHGAIVFENAFGAHEKISASCGGSIGSCRIDRITIDGEDAMSAPAHYRC